jgi:hypothetical protein
MQNEYHPDHPDAATLAAFVALGAEIATLRAQLQAQRERADEYQRAAALLTMERDVWREIVDGAKAVLGEEWDNVLMCMERSKRNGAAQDA